MSIEKIKDEKGNVIKYRVYAEFGINPVSYTHLTLPTTPYV